MYREKMKHLQTIEPQQRKAIIEEMEVMMAKIFEDGLDQRAELEVLLRRRAEEERARVLEECARLFRQAQEEQLRAAFIQGNNSHLLLKQLPPIAIEVGRWTSLFPVMSSDALGRKSNWISCLGQDCF